MSKQSIRFSIVIPCYNEARYIGDCIRSLQAQDFSGEYEIIIVDNNCTDDTVKIAKELGVTVVHESQPGVCYARQAGTEVAQGEIVISSDADTMYRPNWLSNIDRHYRKDERVIAVVGPCRFRDGPIWGRIYPLLLFGIVYLAYLLTGRSLYASATNISFKRAYFPGYDVKLTQGGDELDVLRNMRRQAKLHNGKIIFDNSNPTLTSGRRLTRGLLYNIFVTFLTYYLLEYMLSRIFKRRILGSAPAYRDSGYPLLNHLQTLVIDGAILLLILMPFAYPRHYVFRVSSSIRHYIIHKVKREHP